MIMNIREFIPIGKRNAVSRKELVAATGLPDRTLRQMIHQARIECSILSREDGGYYIPSEDEINELVQFCRREEHRAKAIYEGLRGAYAQLAKRNREEEIPRPTNCKRCGRLLTSAEAIGNGYGHICMMHEIAEAENKKQITIEEISC